MQVPAFFILYPTLPVPYLIGTNRLASAMGTGLAAWNYSRAVRLPWRPVLHAAAGASVMAYLGALVQSVLPAALLKAMILVVIVVIGVYTFRQKTLGQEDNLRVQASSLSAWSLLIGGAMGFYNGLIGPGTGSLLVFAFVSVIGFSFLSASAISKVVNVIADASSLIFFFTHHYVLFHISLPLMVCNMAGAYVGSRMAVLRGNAFMRQVFMVVMGAMVLRFAWDVVGHFWK